MREFSDKILLIISVVLAIAGFFALFGVTCGRARAADPCWDCLTRADAWRADKDKGDIIDCKPAGWKWGKAELDTKKYKVIRVCATPEQAQALSAKQVDKEGKSLNVNRFGFTVVDETPLLVDKTILQVISPADAKAAIDAAKSEPLDLPAEEIR